MALSRGIERNKISAKSVVMASAWRRIESGHQRSGDMKKWRQRNGNIYSVAA